MTMLYPGDVVKTDNCHWTAPGTVDTAILRFDCLVTVATVTNKVCPEHNHVFLNDIDAYGEAEHDHIVVINTVGHAEFEPVTN